MTIESLKPVGDAEITGAAPRKAAARSHKAPRTMIVEIAFTPDQIAYLDERMSIVRDIRPMRRAGGSSLSRRRPVGLLAT